MQYLLLIYGQEATDTPQDELDASMKEWFDYTEDLRKSGAMLGGDPLQSVATATTVREKDGEQVVTDGPFAETREVLGGYYLIDVPNLDEALEWAKKCPGTKYGAVEVRPVVVFDRPA